MRRDGVVRVLPWVVAAAFAVAAIAFGVVARDRGAQLDAMRATQASLSASVEAEGVQIQELRSTIDDLRATLDKVLVDLRAAERLAERRAELLRALRATSEVLRTCSAAGMSGPTLSADLPLAVRDTAEAIVAAASACDLPGLARLAVDDAEFPFAYGLDATQPPAMYWTQEEWDDEAPMRHLVELFSLPVGTRDGFGRIGTEYVWPSAAAYGSWAAVPEGEKAPVRAWYEEAGLDVPVYDGTYWGWRLVIDAQGNWRVFVTSPD